MGGGLESRCVGRVCGADGADGAVRVTVHPRTCHEVPERKSMYSNTLSLTSALDGGGWPTPRPRPLYPQERDPVHIV